MIGNEGDDGKVVSLLSRNHVGIANHLFYGIAAIKDKCDHLASEIEQQIFVHHGEEVNGEYKEAIRSHVLNLKDTKNNLRNRILNDQLNASTFADMVSDFV